MDRGQELKGCALVMMQRDRTSEWMKLWCCCTFPWPHVLTFLFLLILPPSPVLLFCLKFNKVWNSEGLKRASGVFWLSFMSHAGAMWTQWHWGRGRRGEGVPGWEGSEGERGREQERRGGSEKTKEGKSLIRGAGKNRKVEAKWELIKDTKCLCERNHKWNRNCWQNVTGQNKHAQESKIHRGRTWEKSEG